MAERTRNVEWDVESEHGGIATWEKIGIAVLMDIRRELQRLNAAIYCPNFLAMPHTLTRISRNTAKPKKTRRAKKKTAVR